MSNQLIILKKVKILQERLIKTCVCIEFLKHVVDPIIIKSKIVSNTIQMLRSYSPKQLKAYLSSSHLNCYLKESSGRKNSSNQSPMLPKQLGGTGQGHISHKYALSKGSKGSMKLSHKYDPKKKYLFNNTAYGTPTDGSMIPSYISTPN